MAVNILGMNARNLSYIVPNNNKKATALADNKLESKRLLQEYGVPVPRFLGSIQNTSEVLDFDWEGLPQRFVVKPNAGFGGEGIIVLQKRTTNEQGETEWIAKDGSTWNVKQLQAHVLNVIDGSFSITNSPDIAFFEEKVVSATEIREISRYGVPDIRIIVFNNVPVMAMLRIPTRKSRGRANVSQGAIGCGVDIATGVTTSAMTKARSRKIVETHPDSGIDLQGIEVPYWEEMLEYAIRAQEASGLGYLGIDFAIDKYKGPVVLEMNARPGLDIQIANLASLSERLKRVKGLNVSSVKKGIAIAKNLFGGDIERRVQDVSGLKVLGGRESIKIQDVQKNYIQVFARIDTGENLSIIDEEFAAKLKLPIKEQSPIKKKKKRDVVTATILLGGVKMETKFVISALGKKKSKVIIGRRDLRGFLVDPTKKS